MQTRTNYSHEDRALLRRFVTDLDSDVYCVVGLPPEVVAVLFAYVSRSSASFRDNLLKLLKQDDLWPELLQQPQLEVFTGAAHKARKFHEKWVIGYGHASVAEHADLKICVQGCSIVASKVIEDARLGSYTEKSTRYQVFERSSLYSDETIAASQAADVYRSTCDWLFDLYEVATDRLKTLFSERHPQEGRALVRARACDVARLILPAATRTSIGISYNARVAAQAIVKLLSHPLPELQHLGEQIKRQALQICPSLVRHAEPSAYRSGAGERLRRTGLPPGGASEAKSVSAVCVEGPEVTLVDEDSDAETRLCAAALMPHTTIPFSEALQLAKDLPRERRADLIDAFFEGRGDHEAPHRELEYIPLQAEFVIDYGSYRDIQRHRICTQTPQEGGVALGYIMMPEMQAVGLADDYHSAMQQAADAYHQVEHHLPGYGAYVVPLAFRKRVLFAWNLREVFHFIELRSSPAGHSTYRVLAQKLYRELQQVWPTIMRHCRVHLD